MNAVMCFVWLAEEIISFLIKKRKIKEQMKIILAQYFFEIFSQISSSGKIFNKNIMKLTPKGISNSCNFFHNVFVINLPEDEI